MKNSKKEKLLVTGGLGFIGSHIVNRFQDSYKIVVVDHNHSPESEKILNQYDKTIEVIRENIADFKYWEDIGHCDYIFHGAAQIAAEKSIDEPFEDYRSNSIGTLRIAEHARKHKSGIIYCNTIRVYDPKAVDIRIEQKKAISENCPIIFELSDDTPPFAISKYIGEQYLRWYSQKFKIKVINHRMSSIVGPGQNSSEIHGWVNYIIRCAVEKKEYRIFGHKGQQSRDILHIEDLMDLIEIELNDFNHFSENGFMTYNIGGGIENRISINQIIDCLKNDFGLKLKTTKAFKRKGDPVHYYSEISKIRRKGWPKKKLKGSKEIINELIMYYLERKGIK